MEISRADWSEYVRKLSAIDSKAASLMEEYIASHGYDDPDALVRYAHALATKYGEASGALACEMYDEVAAAQGASVPPAVPADTATYGETAKAVRGTMKTAPASVPATTGRLVKQVGADTILKNAERDGAQFAWVPSGDTCVFCITLASNGWQYMSKNALKGGHAEHIHANCDCTYAVRFDEKSGVKGYDPKKYKEMYDNAEGSTPNEKINSIRREQYAADPERYRAQKKISYDRNRKLKYGEQSTISTDRGAIEVRKVDKYGYNNIYVANNVSLTERQLRTIDRQISEAKSVLGIENSMDAKVVVSDLGDVLASYNPRTNVLQINKTMTSDEAIIIAQKDFACPTDTRSTAVHEMIHWKDADEYKRSIGSINDAGTLSDYSVYQRENSYNHLRSVGVNTEDLESIRSISTYAYKSAVDNDWEEVYTEYRTREVLS